MKFFLLVLLLHMSLIAFCQDGILDETFVIGTGADADVNSIERLDNGKVLIAGQFVQYNGQTVNGLARLNSDGSLDTTFTTPAAPQTIYKTFVQEDGKIFVTTTFNCTLTRLNADGTVDTSFTAPANFSYNGEIVSISKQGDKYIVSGAFSLTGMAQPLSDVIRLNADGTLDVTFAAVSLYSQSTSYAFTQLMPDNKIIATGVFEYYGDTPVVNLIRLNADGTLDDSFNAGTGVAGRVLAIALQPDGKIIIAGYITAVNGVNRNLIARLNADGSVDESFVPPAGDSVAAYDIVLQPDGKIITGGNFNDSEIIFGGVDNSVPVYIKRFNTNGTLDTTFVSEGSIGNQVKSLALQGDGKVLAGGWFTTVGTAERNKIARLNNTILSVKENQLSAFSAYPNPVKDKLTIATAGFMPVMAKITVYDSTGKILYAINQDITGNVQLDMANYQNGLYFVTITAGNTIATQKIIKH